MEDSHIAIFDFFGSYHLFAVMDGHGGSEVAQYVQCYLPNYIKENPNIKTKKWKELFTTSFSTVDQSLLTEDGQAKLVEYSKKNQPDEFRFVSEAEIYKHVGCTLCMGMIADSEIIVANSGDSRCVLGVKGKAVDMSVDHKPELDVERKRIEAAKGFVEDNRVNGNLNLSRSIGDFEYKSDKTLNPEQQQVIYLPDVKVAKLSPDVDFMVIACDGIWEVWESQKVVDFIYSKLNNEVKLSAIIDEMFEKLISQDSNSNQLGCDNMTCVLIQFKK